MYHLRGALLAVLADTPASQAVAGMKESVGGARRKCRHCMATYEQMQEQFLEEQFTLRSKEKHEYQLQKLENAPSKYLKSYYSKAYGINTRSKILEAPHFDVTQQLPQDIMHVFLEGILSYHLKNFLAHFFSETTLTLDQLNSEIRSFPLGYSQKKNRPTLIKESDLQYSSSTNLGQTAAQMHLLAYILPFILGKYSDLDDTTTNWDCYMTLLEIMTICFSSVIEIESVVYLRWLISEHLNHYKELYDARITPKMHYMIHLPSLIMKFGPLIRSWCMRFEAKHSYFKGLSRVIKNFKNLPYTLSYRHQSMQFAENATICSNQVRDRQSLGNDYQLGKSKEVCDEDLRAHIKDKLKSFYDIQYDRRGGIYKLSTVTVNSTQYIPGANTFLVSHTDDDNPEFGQLQDIWFVEEHGVFLVLKIMETVGFCSALNAYEIKDPDLPQGHEIKALDRLSTPWIYHSYKFDSQVFIVKRELFV
ncbi:uncharacterized protein LOC110234145 isoform X1 [Exaiptasia diaphana]|uniref:Uncharacterized protein n=1 Tax=Exaiptasia diaphana TaxID=2652724 RepID=A0A913YG43_EXADI|nr:uncharacterized protein LOC110234145 isoform X1 [Exaiptasia diaphana]XP_028513406.1 uncharacterized protein LOC110234145 isoform X1 [Exaiptasia diaphana]